MCTFESWPINKLEDLAHELKIRADKNIGGEGIKDIALRKYIKSLIIEKREENGRRKTI